MRLLHTCQTLSRTFGGVFEAVRQLVSAQCHATPTLRVKVIGARDAYTPQDASHWPQSVGSPYRIWGPRAVGWTPQIRRVYSDFRPDIVHVHGLWMFYGAANRKLASQCRIPYIISPHGMLDPWALRQSSLKKSLAWLLFEGQHLRSATCLHALCDSEAAHIRELGLKNPIAVIPNGINVLSTPSCISDHRMRATPERNLLFLGRIHPKKGIDNLLNAWRDLVNAPLANESRKWRLVIAGWGDRRYVRQIIKRAGDRSMNNTISFLGPVFGDKKSQILAAADAFILPSVSEGLPMAVLEAWSYAVPVVMTAECNLPEGFASNAAVRTGPSDSEIAKTLREFMRRPDAELQQIGRNGADLTRQRFSWPVISEHFSRVYAWMTNTGPFPTDLIR